MLPGQYTRLDLFASQLDKQQKENAAAAEKARVQRDKDKKKQDLQDAKQRETYFKSQKETADKELSVKKQIVINYKKTETLPSSDGGATVTPAESAVYNGYVSDQLAAQKTLDSITTQYKAAVSSRASIESSIKFNPLSGLVASGKANTLGKKPKGGNNDKSKIHNPLIYYYNAPMINTSYLNTDGPQQQTIKQPTNDPGNVLKAQESWTDAYLGSKGIIQMDSDVVMNTANYAPNKDNNYDGNLYGFKFLYNPKEVNMTWAVAEGMNWEGIQAGLDPGTAPTAALNNSTISFSLLLNRIGDMGYLTSKGLKQNVNPYTKFNIIPGKTIDQEVSEIYNKGTMYDLEYLFKTISGINSTFTSKFSDITADRGWLYGFAVELHLGNKMRYKVRISSLEVNHAMFDERMVPILSYVNITCARFPNVSQPGVGGGA
jgi:hypothetical protein